MAVPVVCALGLSALRNLPASPGVSGSADLPVRVVVVDADDGRPIEGAAVELMSGELNRPPHDRAVTDWGGIAGMRSTFFYEDQSSILGRWRQFHLDQHYLKASAGGRETAVVSLGDVGRVSGERGIDARIPLRKGPPPALDAVAGEYVGVGTRAPLGGEIEQELRVKADGSFACYTYDCWGSVSVYGTASLEGGRLRLRAARSDWALGVVSRQPYEPITWGGWTLLVPSDRMDAFCWAVGQGVEDDLPAWGLLFPLDYRGTPLRGWPSVPERYRHYFPKSDNSH
jgi:hypothetical protein